MLLGIDYMTSAMAPLDVAAKDLCQLLYWRHYWSQRIYSIDTVIRFDIYCRSIWLGRNTDTYSNNEMVIIKRLVVIEILDIYWWYWFIIAWADIYLIDDILVNARRTYFRPAASFILAFTGL